MHHAWLVTLPTRIVGLCQDIGMGFRRIAVGLSSAVLLVAQPAAPFEVEEATIAQVHDAMRERRLTCRQLVDAYIRRINAYDKNGPAINAIVTLNPDATKEADELDRRFAQSGLTGPLHCVPMIVKDNFETKGLQTSDGALAFAGYQPKEDATQVARVKAAGAIVLAKSNMAEWAFSPVETVSSILPGYTKNPYALDRVTAGSSGGTAASVAASFGLAGFGSDTGDSIRGPSSHQALAGIRSTMGLTSRAGVFPLNLRADIAGPMARTLEDAVKIFQVIVGEDPRDPVTAAARGARHSGLQQVARPEWAEGRGDRGVARGVRAGHNRSGDCAHLRGGAGGSAASGGNRDRSSEVGRTANQTADQPPPMHGLQIRPESLFSGSRRASSCSGPHCDSEVGEISSLDAEAAGGCRERTGKRAGFGSMQER